MIEQWQEKIMYQGLATKGRIITDEAEARKIEKQLEKDPLNFYLWNALGVVTPDADKAINAYSTAISIRPLASNQYYNRARRYTGQSRWEQAIADFKIATAIDKDDGWKWHMQGVTLYFLNRFEEAIDTFNHAVELYKITKDELIPFEVEWMWNSYMKIGKFEEGAKCLELVDQNTPIVDSEKTYKKRILLYRGIMSEKDYLDSIELGEDLEIIDQMEAVNQFYGYANYQYYVKKDTKKSVEYLDKALAIVKGKGGWGYKMALLDRPIRAKELGIE